MVTHKSVYRMRLHFACRFTVVILYALILSGTTFAQQTHTHEYLQERYDQAELEYRSWGEEKAAEILEQVTKAEAFEDADLQFKVNTYLLLAKCYYLMARTEEVKAVIRKILEADRDFRFDEVPDAEQLLEIAEKVRESMPSRQPPMIHDVLPSRGYPGSSIAIEGSGFESFMDSSISVSFFNDRTARLDSSKSGTLYVRVPNRAETGVVTVTTPNGLAVSMKPFEVIDVPGSPPYMAQLASSGIFVACGLAYVLLDRRANGKWNEYAADPGLSPDLYDSYLDAHRVRNWSGAVWITAGAVTAYLWYRYFSARNADSDRTEKTIGLTGLELGSDFFCVTWSLRF